MQAGKSNIYELFNGTKQYVIPSYQRPEGTGNGVSRFNFDRQNLVVGPDEAFELKCRAFITEFGVF